MSGLVVLGLFDNPVFQSELLFLFVTIFVFFGMTLIAGRSILLSVFGSFLILVHIVTAVGSTVSALNVAFWAVMAFLIVYMMAKMASIFFGGSSQPT